MDADARRSVRDALRRRYPWVADPLWGPTAVEAGECDACGVEPRLVEVCGRGAHRYVGRTCAGAGGDALWCGGHSEDAAAALAWLARLPAEADTVARVWWVATGEVRLDPAIVAASLQRLALTER